jgi:single-stranded-DNA-specific exonuclease
MKQAGEEFFVDYGGHVLAAGFTAKEDKIDLLQPALQDAFEKVKKEQIENVLWIDKEVGLNEVDWGFLKIIEKFRPFGIDNPKPVFLFKDLEVFNVKMFGNGGIHLQLDFETDGGTISAIGFFMQNNGGFEVNKGSRIDLVASVERNTFGGRNELRLRIIDLHVIK